MPTGVALRDAREQFFDAAEPGHAPGRAPSRHPHRGTDDPVLSGRGGDCRPPSSPGTTRVSGCARPSRPASRSLRKAMIASHLVAERELGRVAADADIDTLDLTLIEAGPPAVHRPDRPAAQRRSRPQDGDHGDRRRRGRATGARIIAGGPCVLTPMPVNSTRASIDGNGPVQANPSQAVLGATGAGGIIFGILMARTTRGSLHGSWTHVRLGRDGSRSRRRVVYLVDGITC